MIRFLSIALVFSLLAVPAAANQLNQWSVSCGVDKGSFTKKGKQRIFKTSSNQCSGGTYKQRAEIKSKKVSPSHKGTYLFSTTVSMTNDKNEKFDIFQMHDGREGCAPPLKVVVLSNGKFRLDADYKTGPGESCVRDVMAQKSSKITFKRDGTPQELNVIVDFLGDSSFFVQVSLDGKVAAQGRYKPPVGSQYAQSKHFYFKHGVYSKNIFDYELVSQDMRVRRVKTN